MTFDAAYARCIRFLPPLFLAMCTNGENIGFCKFYLEFWPPFPSQTLVNFTPLDPLRCVVYFYNRLKVICAASKHLERDKFVCLFYFNK